jgi:hypothetical protein
MLKIHIEMHVGLHVKGPLLMPFLNKIGISQQTLEKSPVSDFTKIHISVINLLLADRWIDMVKSTFG